ncbi:helicase HerA domain-containing protein [Gordonia sp. DT219]|uniref:helicase HerA domain-containing protein n=1 Tax=Gordonia sp. DT219 TaxID=3416658 RepID=UPI003CEF5B20
MERQTRQALESIRLDWADTPDDVWGAANPYHVDGLHSQIVVETMRSFDDAQRSESASPIGVVIRGVAGSGKTHLLGQVRQRVQSTGGYFFLLKLLDGSDFWKSTTVAILESLNRPGAEHPTQLAQLLDHLARESGVPETTRLAVIGAAPLTGTALEEFVAGVYRHHAHRRRSQHILRALVLTASQDDDAKDLGEAFLHLDVDDADELAEWGIRNAKLGYQEIVQNISRIVAFDNAAVLAIDQIDTLIEAGKSALTGEESIVEQVAHGLMALRENMSRTSTVVSCITAAWDYLEGRAMRSASERFRKPPMLQRPASADFGRELLAKRFAPGFARADFTPPYPTWPVALTALTSATQYTPRELMIAVDRQIAAMLRSGDFHELVDLADTDATPIGEPAATHTDTVDGESAPATTAAATPGQTATGPKPELAELDRRYEDLIARADPLPALVSDGEDRIVPGLLRAGLGAWIEAVPADPGEWRQDPKPGAKPVLHGRIRHIIDSHRELDESWSFRAISATNPRAVQTRLANATTAAGLSLGTVERTLVILRREPWPNGPKTAQMVDELHSRGGKVVAWSEPDIRRLMALTQLGDEHSPHLHDWIVARNPAAEIELFTEILGTGTARSATSPASAASAPVTATAQPPHAARAPHAAHHRSGAVGTLQSGAADILQSGAADELPLGHRTNGGEPVSVPLVALRKHIAIFAGTGSGKTVLIRRIVEEAALQGVSAIVLDINNDLSRLGTPWPPATRTWSDAEGELADRYFADTEVVVFTPGRKAGRPLSFRPLPDFAALEQESDEFTAAVDSAVGALLPRARPSERGAKAGRYEAVLRQAMVHFGHSGGGSLQSLVTMLSELPDGVSTLADAPRLAIDLSENLKASMANDPLLDGDAAPADPGFLLTPSPGRRARVSVINLAGLGGEERVANFVGQLQMSLFAWIKKNPAADRPLGGILVMDEAQNYAPSQGTTSAMQSTLALASQARKYGLGLIFATQAPKGIHGRVSGNASTQFFGKLNHPNQIEAAKELAASKGSPIPDVGRLSTGTFYTAVDGGRFIKVDTPLCLSYHPQSPPTEDEVIALSRP